MADDGVHGKELWIAAGDPLAPRLVRDINAGRADGVLSRAVRLGNEVFFAADNGSDGVELWVSDGTAAAAATRMLKNINTAPRGNGLTPGAEIFLWKDQLFFAASDGDDCDGDGVDDDGDGRTDEDHGRELWASDGTTAGTRQLDDLHATGGSAPRLFTPMGEYLYFVATDATGEKIGATDGIAGHAAMLTPAPGARSLTVMGDRLFFVTQAGAVRELWATTCRPGAPCGIVSDCTQLATWPAACKVATLPHLAAAAPATDLVAFEDALYFVACESGDCEPWVSDGTAANTHQLAELETGSAGSAPHAFVVAGPHLFFVATPSASAGTQLFATDGTGVWAIDTRPGAPDRVANLAAFSGRLFFAADAGLHARRDDEYELFVSDGTSAGTHPACRERAECTSPTSFAVVDGHLFMSLETSSGAEPVVYP